MRKDWQQSWDRLKNHISGSREEISDLEKLLLTNDSEKLFLDPEEPDFIASEPSGVFKPSGGS